MKGICRRELEAAFAVVISDCRIMYEQFKLRCQTPRTGLL